MADQNLIVKCPVCGEEVDLRYMEKAVSHMEKDDAHKSHLENVKINRFLRMTVEKDILRRLK